MSCRTNTTRRGQRGVVLVLVLALMGIFSLLGLYYVRYMTLENDAAEIAVREVRARQIATAGFEAALGRLTVCIAENSEARLFGQRNEIELPTYQRLAGDTLESPLHAREDRIARAVFTVYDESGKVNLNHAPASMLQAVLDVDGETARKITSSRPNLALPPNERTGAWLLSPDELVTRGLLSAEQYDALDDTLLTTYSVVNHEQAKSWLNLNTCPPEVLAAVVGLPAEQGAALAEKRPFDSLAGLASAAGKEPATFNIPPSAENPTALPAALASRSRCFRIVSEGVFALKNADNSEYRPARQTLEAVVALGEDDTFQVVAWNLSAGETGA